MCSEGCPVEFRILGPIELWSGDRRHDVGWARERTVLASLLLVPGQPVSVEALVEHVWDTDPPAQARERLYASIARLRGRLHDLDETVRLRHRSGAYVLETDPAKIDLYRSRMLKAQARAAAEGGDHEHAIRLYREAQSLWRGEPLAGLAGGWAVRTRKALEDELLSGTIERLELELRVGNHTELVAEASELVARFPFDEKLVELLMLALYQSGRQADALTVYQQARRRLVDELAAEPGPGLRELHQRILRGEPILPVRPARADEPPNNLPRDLSTFTGRSAELAHLTGLASAQRAATAVLTIDGMAGIGKTALAVHLAHLLSGDYPDGRLFLDLYGHHATQAPLDPATALDRLLRLLGVAPSRIPSELDDRAAVWRAELARRRMLFILDDAIEHDQIRHLLPGSPGCLAIVTSRRQLAGLDDVHALSLDILPPQDAAALLSRVVGLQRSLDAHDVDLVVGQCAYLPLAIQLVGNRLRHRPTWSAADLAAQLAGRSGAPGRRLSAIRAEDRHITAAFDLSYQGLAEDQRRAFRRLSLHPGSEISADCAEALIGSAEAEWLVDSLLDHHLLSEVRRGHYRFHALIAEYARMLGEQDPQEEREAATDRLLDHYLVMADCADRLLYPQGTRLDLQTYHPLGRRPEPARDLGMETPDQARTWFEEELDNLLRVVRHAAEHERPMPAALLSHLLSHHLEASGHWSEAAQVHERAVRLWRALGDRRGIACSLTDECTILWRTGQHAEALGAADEALSLQRVLGDQHGVGELLDKIGQIHWHLSEFDVAFGYLEEALAIRRTLGDHQGEAASLGHLAIVCWHRGDHHGAADRFREALVLHERAGDVRGLLMTHNNIGDVEFHLGHYDAALEHYEKAAAIAEMGRQYKAIWLNNMANVLHRTGRSDEALGNYRAALEVYREIGDRRGESETLNNIGHCYLGTGWDGQGLIHYQKALHLAQEIGERYVAAQALRGIGKVHGRGGRHGIAMEHYSQALDLARSIGDSYQEARILEDMGTALSQAGNAPQATWHWNRALELYNHLGVPEAEQLRKRLDPPLGAAEF